MKQKTIWQIEDRKEFYHNLEAILRRDILNKRKDACIEYFVGQHIDELSLDFLREVKQKVNWEKIYKDIVYNGLIDKIKDSQKFKQFFKGCEDWDI